MTVDNTTLLKALQKEKGDIPDELKREVTVDVHGSATRRMRSEGMRLRDENSDQCLQRQGLACKCWLETRLQTLVGNEPILLYCPIL